MSEIQDSKKSELQAIAEREVKSLHVFLESWFQGTIPEDSFKSDFLMRFSDDFVQIPPAGSIMPIEALADSLKPGYGKNPNFRITIRDVVVRTVLPGHMLVTYEELQEGAMNSTPPTNVRVSTALFAVGERLTWLHLQETHKPAGKTSPEKSDL